MKGIILASHGALSEGLLATLTIFSGEQLQLETLCLMPEEDVADFMDKLKTSIHTVDTGDGVVIFCDLLFGSPCNCSARLLSDPLYKDRISVITGMNLSMVLEFVAARENGMESELLVSIGQQGIVDFNKLFAERANKISEI